MLKNISGMPSTVEVPGGIGTTLGSANSRISGSTASSPSACTIADRLVRFGSAGLRQRASVSSRARAASVSRGVGRRQSAAVVVAMARRPRHQAFLRSPSAAVAPTRTGTADVDAPAASRDPGRHSQADDGRPQDAAVQGGRQVGHGAAILPRRCLRRHPRRLRRRRGGSAAADRADTRRSTDLQRNDPPAPCRGPGGSCFGGRRVAAGGAIQRLTGGRSVQAPS